MLTKQEWLDRYRAGDLVNGAFAWEDIHVRAHADTVYVRGIQSQEVCFRGETGRGQFRATLVAVRQNGRWAIVNLQLSELEEPDPEKSGP